MKIIIFLILISTLNAAFSQSTTSGFVRFKSKISRVLTRESENDTSKWKHKDFMMDHLIIVDNTNKKIITYREKKEFEIDILSAMTKEVRNTITIYKYHCLGGKNKECDVIIQFLENKPFALHIDYPLIQFWYFLEE